MALQLNKLAVDNATKPKSGLEKLFREKEVASILGISTASLQRDRWAAKKEGSAPKIPFLKMLNGSVRYHPDDIRAVIVSTNTPTQLLLCPIDLTGLEVICCQSLQSPKVSFWSLQASAECAGRTQFKVSKR